MLNVFLKHGNCPHVWVKHALKVVGHAFISKWAGGVWAECTNTLQLHQNSRGVPYNVTTKAPLITTDIAAAVPCPVVAILPTAWSTIVVVVVVVMAAPIVLIDAVVVAAAIYPPSLWSVWLLFVYCHPSSCFLPLAPRPLQVASFVDCGDWLTSTPPPP